MIVSIKLLSSYTPSSAPTLRPLSFSGTLKTKIGILSMVPDSTFTSECSPRRQLFRETLHEASSRCPSLVQARPSAPIATKRLKPVPPASLSMSAVRRPLFLSSAGETLCAITLSIWNCPSISVLKRRACSAAEPCSVRYASRSARLTISC